MKRVLKSLARWWNGTLAPRRLPARPNLFRPGFDRLDDRILPSVTYGGGPLIPNVHVETLYYGSGWSSSAAMQQQTQTLDAFFKTITNSSYMDMLHEYSQGSYAIGRGGFTGHDLVPGALPANLTDAQIQQMIAGQIKNGAAPAPSPNRLYFVFVAPGTEVSTANGQNSVSNFEGYHSAFQYGTGWAYYAVIPYAGAPNFVENAVTANGINPLRQMTMTASHELAEAVTDPMVGNGWVDRTIANGEIGDLARNAPYALLNGYVVQQEWNYQTNAPMAPAGATVYSQSNFPAPSLIGPGGTLSNLKPTFTWNAVAGADHYAIQVNDLTTGQTVIQNWVITSTSFTPASPLVAGHRYAWWVQAVAPTGFASAWSSQGNFAEQPPQQAPPSAPTLLGPSGSSYSARPTFTWNAATGADHYYLYVLDATTNQAVIQNTNVPGTSFTSTVALTAGHTYNWWVMAVAATGATSAWSNASVFTEQSLAAPVLLGPSGQAATTRPTFTWNAVPGADHYYLYVLDATTNQAVIQNTNLKGTSFTPNVTLTAGHAYQWWVLAFAADGTAGPWSNYGSFSD